MTLTFTDLAGMAWGVADTLRGDYKQTEYGRIILPFTILRRLDCALENTKAAVLAEAKRRKGAPTKELAEFLNLRSGQPFHNISPLTYEKALKDPATASESLLAYVRGFSEGVSDIFQRFKFTELVKELDEKDLLFKVASAFAAFDLHPEKVSNELMGHMFEELIRRFADASNETAGEHFTPREVVQLMVGLLFQPDKDALEKKGAVRMIYDPTAGTGGMLSVAATEAQAINPLATIRLFGQELNDESYAICKADMLFKGQDPGRVACGNTLTKDAFPDQKFDYMLSNPPFGVDWKKIRAEIEGERDQKGPEGRFGAGTPRISDGSLLFLQHLVSKMRPAEQDGSRIAIVLNGSPLFSGGAGSGESNIRRWLFENDLIEAIIGLPTEMFFNTGIATYIWVLTNAKKRGRRGKVLLVDASSMAGKLRRAVGSKRMEMRPEDISRVLEIYRRYESVECEGKPLAKLMSNDDFGYREITVEHPLRDKAGKRVTKGGKKGAAVTPDPALRSVEIVPLAEKVKTYFEREVLPYAPGAWIAEDKTQIGYGIPFAKHFFAGQPPRSLALIDADIKRSTDLVAVVSNTLNSGITPTLQSNGSDLNGAKGISSDWTLVPLRHLASFRKGRLPAETSPAPVADGDMPYLAMDYLRGETELPRYVSAEHQGVRAEEGDTLILWDGSNAGEFLPARAGVVSSTTALVQPRNIDKRFFFFACKSLQADIQGQTVGMGIPHVSGDDLKACRVAVPSLEVQKEIADFLEEEIKNIDVLVAEQSRLIALLKEKKESLIHAAVTGEVAVSIAAIKAPNV